MNTDSSKEDRITLELLDAIDQRSDVSQRHLARQMGVALGLANSYLKRCVRKGFVKISEAPANRYAYYLTPKGFAEKSRLTARYLSTSLAFYRQAGRSCDRIFEACVQKGVKEVLLCGLSDLAEIALLRAMESKVEVVGLYDPRQTQKKFFSKVIWSELEQVNGYEAFMITELSEPVAMYERLSETISPDRLLVPDVLRLGGELSTRHKVALEQKLD
ncbi:MAG: winged helix-turn-helix transcriptional regulator [Gammaproteobacteria bacterium]|nr:winged helix-turn-helix transcriptional regulator [Gammaproteobacteria bacterium]